MYHLKNNKLSKGFLALVRTIKLFKSSSLTKILRCYINFDLTKFKYKKTRYLKYKESLLKTHTKAFDRILSFDKNIIKNVLW